MSIIDKAIALRRTIERLAVQLDDTDALENVELFPNWNIGNDYVIGDRVRYEGVLYKCLQAHTAQDNWSPVNAVSLWTRVLIPDPSIVSDWEQPDSTNAYMTGDKVRHNGKVWVSIVDNNVWEPGVYGWDEVEE